MSETKRLGRGLEALLGPVSREQAEASGALRELPMASVKPNPYQPRTRMDEGPLDELVASMQASGLLQPVVVRPQGGGFELIAGERRWRAASRLGWTKIPAVVKDVDDQTLLTLALIENLQRDDLSPIDEAAGYQRLGSRVPAPARRDRPAGRTQSCDDRQSAPAAAAPGRGAGAGARAEAVRRPRARAPRASPSRRRWSRWPARPRRKGGRCARWRRACAATHPPSSNATAEPAPPRAPRGPNLTADAKRVEDALRKHLGTDVRVTTRRRGRGFLTVSYYSNDDLARLLELILGRPFQG